MKDLTKRHREENKEQRANKIKPKKTETEATENTMLKDVFNDATLHDSTIIEAITLTNIENSNDTCDNPQS